MSDFTPEERAEFIAEMKDHYAQLAAGELEARAIIERERNKGKPARRDYVNRAEYRAALSKWRKEI